mmetsp:Transcript_21379/g.45076  ORF Transcript_21379/g.45076 Transcript_21379/m.45076 type:complete len:88 (-) Transcript_21379:194-457(-)
MTAFVQSMECKGHAKNANAFSRERRGRTQSPPRKREDTFFSGCLRCAPLSTRRRVSLSAILHQSPVIAFNNQKQRIVGTWDQKGCHG